ncbi:hypothetical protein [Glutamicibacter arilaitensis]|uniref:Uncharacterized protein n=1 Tax=Glutamicibacter arilaitensis TaxID=256701 RepID=A0A2N7RZJ3_9MICC|nr:hypothetical protein [Glutamicibacter arilaitensis]PMQ19309.1 hypothetical protein CIK84_11400 [Glutamicibacter arilaitensis]
MGANEKHAATYHGGEYTPSTDSARRAYVFHTAGPKSPPQERAERREHEFDRWLAKIRAEARAEALDEVLTVLNAEIEDAPPANYEEDNYEAGYIDGLMFAEEFTETSADQYKENQS